MEANEQNRWLIKLVAGCMVLACVAFPPLILVIIPAGIYFYFYYEAKNRSEGKK